MASGMLSILFIAMLALALALIAGGIVMLVVGLRRRDDSTSRPFLALGVGLLVVGTVILMPSLLMLGRMFVEMG
ncbi:hypothetical protein [Agrococcus sp. Ld7]|uniref:hypothetical protein n=1 Tax=Agrococcus sp. Ld7 TaxID=649148 RepID=UPI0038672937